LAVNIGIWRNHGAGYAAVAVALIITIDVPAHLNRDELEFETVTAASGQIVQVCQRPADSAASSALYGSSHRRGYEIHDFDREAATNLANHSEPRSITRISALIPSTWNRGRKVGHIPSLPTKAIGDRTHWLPESFD
jgi:hypothetical protein